MPLNKKLKMKSSANINLSFFLGFLIFFYSISKRNCQTKKLLYQSNGKGYLV